MSTQLIETTLGKICQILNGRAYRQNELLSNGKYPVLRVGNFFSRDNWYYSNLELESDKYCDKNDLLFAWSASFGPKIWKGPKVIYHYHIWKLIPKSIVDKYYLYYWLQNSVAMLTAGTHGSVMAHITKNDMENMPITLPDIDIQKKIAGVLSALDDKIELNNQINSNLEQQAQALFNDMFPNILSAETTIGCYMLPKRGKNLLSKDAVYGNVPVVAGGLNPSTYHNQANTTAPVVTISASGANAGFVALWDIPVWASDSSFFDPNVTPYVYFWYTVLKKRQSEIFDLQVGSAQPHIYPQQISIMPIEKLNEDTVKSYELRVKTFFETIGNNKRENQRLSKIRDSLLPKLMSGEIDVSKVDIEQIVNNKD